MVKRGDDVFSGYGFRSDPELTHIVFRRQVSGVLTDTEMLEEEDRPPVEPDTLQSVMDTLPADTTGSVPDTLVPDVEPDSAESPDG